MTTDELHAMLPDELRLILMRLDMTQQRAARLLGRNERTMRYWVAGTRAMPLETAIVMRLLASGRIGVEDIEAAARTRIT